MVDAEDGDVRLGLARRLAEAMGAHYTALPDLQPDTLTRVVEAVVARDPERFTYRTWAIRSRSPAAAI